MYAGDFHGYTAWSLQSCMEMSRRKAYVLYIMKRYDRDHCHCSRNILLDKDFTAKLGDFGFTQEIPYMVGERSMITAAMVAKSMGYCPPEMDTAHISCKSDMYCYGVVRIKIMYECEWLWIGHAYICK